MIFGVFGWVVVGTILGFIFSKSVRLRGDDPRLGIASGAIGAVVGGMLYSIISGAAVVGFNPRSILFAAVGALAVLVAWHVTRRRAALRG